MSRTAWQYSIYSTSWSSYVDFSSNPGRVPMQISNISTAEYKRLIDGSEVDVIPEVKYLPSEMAWDWLYQRDNDLYDLIDGWNTNHTPTRIKDNKDNVYEGYLTSVVKVLPPQKSYSDGSETFIITTKFHRIDTGY